MKPLLSVFYLITVNCNCKAHLQLPDIEDEYCKIFTLTEQNVTYYCWNLIFAIHKHVSDVTLRLSPTFSHTSHKMQRLSEATSTW